jgi:hypothetical protein
VNLLACILKFCNLELSTLRLVSQSVCLSLSDQTALQSIKQESPFPCSGKLKACNLPFITVPLLASSHSHPDSVPRGYNTQQSRMTQDSLLDKPAFIPRILTDMKGLMLPESYPDSWGILEAAFEVCTPAWANAGAVLQVNPFSSTWLKKWSIL